MLRATLMLVCVLSGAVGLRAVEELPPFVEKLAQEAFVRIPPADLKEGEVEFRQLFSSAFLSGFLSPSGQCETASHISIRLGFEAGQSYRSSFPERVESVLKAYGYVAIESAGRFFWNRHISGFRPEDQARVTWSLESLGSAWPKLEDDKGSALPVTREMNLRVKGFLSPKGKFGHDGTSERRLLFTHVERRNE